MDSDEIGRAERLADEPPDDHVPEPDMAVVWELLASEEDYEWTETL